MYSNTIRPISSLLIALAIATSILFMTSPAATAGSRSSCPSGSFCVWALPDFEGVMRKYDNVDAYNSITVDPIGSAYNNRSKRSYLNQLSGHSEVNSCFGPGDYDNELTSWQTHANSAFLSTYTNC